ncbi:unnamed protein product [Taenia asiatica]|uniref:Uncharacterized protein n=1 Tax=Taenia asiatica TaxID=60517 RepID=A0A0R3W1X4_TAEAS|nr:unnamed protein product [Taenia asiatica]
MLYETNRAADTMDGVEVESHVEETELLVACAVDSCIDVSEASAVVAISVLMDAAVDCEWICVACVMDGARVMPIMDVFEVVMVSLILLCGSICNGCIDVAVCTANFT